MQHYRLPTRLLDWTISPLIAAYFVVSSGSENIDKDGVIWGLVPKELNRPGGEETDEILDHPVIRMSPGGTFPMAGSNSPAWPVFSAAFTGKEGDVYEKIWAIKSNYPDTEGMGSSCANMIVTHKCNSAIRKVRRVAKQLPVLLAWANKNLALFNMPPFYLKYSTTA